MRLRKKMNSKEISELIDRLEDALINEHRLIKENVELKEKVLDYARRLDEANDKIDLLLDRIEDLQEKVLDVEWQREMDLIHYLEEMNERDEIMKILGIEGME